VAPALEARWPQSRRRGRLGTPAEVVLDSSLAAVPRGRLLFFFLYVENVEKRSLWQRRFFFHPATLPRSSRAYRRIERERAQRYVLFRERVQPHVAVHCQMRSAERCLSTFHADGLPRTVETVQPW
jgi:hypothetical protein